jgi:hypothetical protein
LSLDAKAWEQIKTKRTKPAMSYRHILTKASGYVACEGAEMSRLQSQGSVWRLKTSEAITLLSHIPSWCKQELLYLYL